MKTLGKLHISTPSDREILMTREFHAPRELVFDAYTKPELVKQWLGVFGGWTLPVCEIDLRVGGVFRYVWKDAKGNEMAMSAVVRELVIPERIVSLETFDDPWYEGEGLVTITFIERGGRTTLAMTARYDTKAIRDAVLQSPMETGVAASYDKLEQILAQ